MNNFEPFPKNPHIARLVPYFKREIFTQMGRSEELGTGVSKVFKYNKIYSKTDTNIFKEEDIFITTVPLKILKKGNNDTLNDRQKQICSIIKTDKYITSETLAIKCNVSIETIKRDFKKLQKLNIIERVGSRKTGYWFVISFRTKTQTVLIINTLLLKTSLNYI